MLSTDPMKDGSSTPLGTTPKTLPQQFPSRLTVDIKSSSSTRQTIQPPMSSSYLEHLSRNFQTTVDLFSPATTKIKSSSPSIPDVPSLNLESEEKISHISNQNFSGDLTGSWTPNGFKVIRKSSSNSLTSTSPIGVAFSMSVKDTLWEER